MLRDQTDRQTIATLGPHNGGEVTNLINAIDELLAGTCLL